jgi:hypothetical protein
MRPFIVTTHGIATLFTYLIKLYDEYSPLHEVAWSGRGETGHCREGLRLGASMT